MVDAGSGTGSPDAGIGGSDADAGAAEAVQLATIFYPHAVAEIKARGQRQVPYDLLGVNPPRDLAYRTIP